MTSVVTGANGYVASRIVYDLLKAGYKVRGTVRDPNDESKVGFLKEMLPELSHQLELVSIPNLRENVGFIEAFEGCENVIHAASPVIIEDHFDPERDVILPAVNGVRFALEAALKNGVKKFVFISSLAAVCGFQRNIDKEHIWTEDDWNDLMVTPYTKSKTLAERFFWEFAKEHPEMDYISINPTLVLGPILDKKLFSSTRNLLRLLNGEYLKDGLSHSVSGIIDVRDVAEGVRKSLLDPNAVGKRFLFGLRGTYHLLHFAQSIERSFPGKYQLPDKFIKGETPITGENILNNSRGIELLGHDFIPFLIKL